VVVAVWAAARASRIAALTLQQGDASTLEVFRASSEPAADCAALNVVWPQE
jgi:hypothetical protein